MDSAQECLHYFSPVISEFWPSEPAMHSIPAEPPLFHPRHWGWTATALVAILVVGIIDYITGPEISFSVFYLLPVAIAAWLSGTRVAVGASVLAAEAEIARMRRYGQSLTLAYIDVDDFKRVNDSQGHAAGDRLLVDVGATIRRNLRATDVVVRYGGDEFVVLLPVTGQQEAHVAIHKLLAAVREAFADAVRPVTLSIGVVTCQSTPPSIDVLMENAYRLMYQSKTADKNSVCFAAYGAA
ncbi:MAG: diguanylate cyclase [Casimicrobiaceae bacterium]